MKVWKSPNGGTEGTALLEKHVAFTGRGGGGHSPLQLDLFFPPVAKTPKPVGGHEAKERTCGKAPAPFLYAPS